MGPRRRVRGDDSLFLFKAGVHANYPSTVLPMKDGLAKLAHFPKELGGSGQVVAE